MRLIDADALKEDLRQYFTEGVLDGVSAKLVFNQILHDIDNAPTVEPQKVVIIPHELIEKLVLCVVDTVENIDWDKAIEAYKARPQGEWVRMALDNKTIVYCSECHTHYEYPFNCCPNCGAQMVGGEP